MHCVMRASAPSLYRRYGSMVIFIVNKESLHGMRYNTFFVIADLNEAGPSQSKYLGTRLYMSPEQNKKEKYGKEVDVYALGIIYYEMNHYFGSDSERSMVRTLCSWYAWLVTFAPTAIQVIGSLRKNVKVSVDFENELPREVSIMIPV